MGYMRLKAGHNLLGIEGEVAWATPGAFTIHNFPCSEDGKNCNDHRKPAVGTHFFQDPSTNVQAVLDQRRRLVASIMQQHPGGQAGEVAPRKLRA